MILDLFSVPFLGVWESDLVAPKRSSAGEGLSAICRINQVHVPWTTGGSVGVGSGFSGWNLTCIEYRLLTIHGNLMGYEYLFGGDWNI